MGSSESKLLPVSDLCVGDLLLFRVAGADPRPYLVRCPSWTGYNHAAFVVGVENGIVSVCGNFSSRTDALGVVSIRELNKDLNSGRLEAVYVRKLVEPLMDNEIAKVVRFAHASMTAFVPALAAEAVSVLMSTPHERRNSSSSLNCISTSRPVERCFSSPPVESFFTSRLVAEMLAQVGRVHESKPHCFSATKEHEHVLRAPIKMQLASGARSEVESAFFTPESSPMAMPSPQSSTRSLQSQQCAPSVAQVGMPTAC